MRSLRSYLPLLLLAMVVNCDKCKKPHNTADEVSTGDVTPPDVKLQVVSVEPDRVDPEKTFDATLFGAGFENGASVMVGPFQTNHVVVQDESTLTFSGPALSPGTYDIKVKNTDGTSATLHGGLSVALAQGSNAGDCSLIRVGFALDSYSLDMSAQQTLTSKLGCFQNVSGIVRIEGHCDERGTTEYNLALGSRRANAVEKFLVSQGVPPSRLRSITYGEERPLDRGHNEAAWAKNRRAEISVLE